MAEYATRAFKIEPGKFADSAREQAHTYNKSSDKTQEQQTHARSGRSETLR
jgi:hypothetical protein